jgi:hypothetical protein
VQTNQLDCNQYFAQQGKIIAKVRASVVLAAKTTACVAPEGFNLAAGPRPDCTATSTNHAAITLVKAFGPNLTDA